MNHLAIIRDLIEDRWSQGSKPEIIINRDRSQQDLQSSDYVAISDGSGSDTELFLSDHRRRSFNVEIMCRTADRVWQGSSISGSERLYGSTTSWSGSVDDHEGMIGEIDRIVETELDGGEIFDVFYPDGGWQRVDTSLGIWAAKAPYTLKTSEPL